MTTVTSTEVPELSLENFVNTFPPSDVPERLAKTTAQTFTRLVRPYFINQERMQVNHPFTCLDDMFERTNRELEIAASFLGTLVIPHCFGIVRAADALEAAENVGHREDIKTQVRLNRYFADIIPRGYVVAAEVPVIDRLRPFDDLTDVCDELGAFQVYRDHQEKEQGYYLYDVWNETQFVTGSIRGQASEGPEEFLVDIEPMYMTAN